MKIGTIGIIGGTGKQGSGLAKQWLRAGYNIIIGSRSFDKGKRIAEEIKASHGEQINIGDIIGGDNELAAKADIVVLAIPADQIELLILPLREYLIGKVVLDVTVEIKHGKFTKAQKVDNKSVYEFIRDLFPASNIVSCLKTISASELAKEHVLNQIDFQMSLNDQALAVAHKLSRKIGLNPIRIRGKNHAFTIERLVALAIQINKEYPGSHVGYNLVNLVKN